VEGKKMRMSDLIKLNDKKPNTSQKFFQKQTTTEKHKNCLQMRNLAVQAEVSDGKKEAAGLYEECVDQLYSVFSKAELDFNIMPAKAPIEKLTTELANQLQLSDFKVMDYFIKQEGENYLYSHCANVTFMSVMVGAWMGYNRSELKALATAAMFHDIGMIKVSGIAQHPRSLKSSERKEIQRHPEYSQEFLRQIPEFDEAIIEDIGKHHLRQNSSKESLSERSQIIGLVDTFEALTHPRPYRAAQEPHSAMRIVIEELKDSFDSSIIKALVDNIGIYPVGTWARLDTDEIALVIDINSGSPLSPKVNILFDKLGERLPESRTVDLSKQSNIHITGPLEEDAMYRIKKSLLSK